MSKKQWLLLFGILILGLVIRLRFFPDNIYFAYDHARDLYVTEDILKGNLKLVGPPSSINPQIFHSPLIYYIYLPILRLLGKDPANFALVLKLFNLLGVILVFYIGKLIISSWVGLIAAFIFAISYEQSQYTLFFAHSNWPVTTNLVFYLGLSLVVFNKRSVGLFVSAVALGISILLHYVNSFLIIVPVILSRRIPKKNFILVLTVFLFFLSPFLIAETRFGFRGLKAVLKPVTLINKSSTAGFSPGQIIHFWIHDNLTTNQGLEWVIMVSLIVFSYQLFINKKERDKLFFFLTWLGVGLMPYLVSRSTGYYYAPAGSVSLVLIFSWLIYQVGLKNWLFAGCLLIPVLFSNLQLIDYQLPKGPDIGFAIQPGMTLGNEKKTLDYIYQKSTGQPFSVYALTNPVQAMSTWSYLFEWYGQEKYGYLPVWGGDNALGFSGNLQVVTNHSLLPKNRFIILEQLFGVGGWLKDDFLRNENYFSQVLEEKQIGPFTIQYREPI